jgi:hypothetical protein
MNWFWNTWRRKKGEGSGDAKGGAMLETGVGYCRFRMVLVALVGLVLLCGVAEAATRTWDGGGGDNNWSTDANWSDDTEPTSSDVAQFDSTSTKNCTIDASISVLGIAVNSGYTGTITQGSSNTITVGTSNWTMATGTFTGGDSNITIDGTLTITGGTFTSTSGVLDADDGVEIQGATLQGPSASTLADVTCGSPSNCIKITGNDPVIKDLEVYGGTADCIRCSSNYPVPGDTAEEEAGVLLAVPRLGPVPDGVVVQDETVGSILKVPLPEFHDLEDLESIPGGVVRAFLVREAFPVAAEHGDLAAKELCIEKGVVALGHKALAGRGGGQVALPGELVTLSEVDGGFLDEAANPERPGGGHRRPLSLEFE